MIAGKLELWTDTQPSGRSPNMSSGIFVPVKSTELTFRASPVDHKPHRFLSLERCGVATLIQQKEIAQPENGPDTQSREGSYLPNRPSG